jgi:SP family arabinose:H+ symporter-like MFS transporter
MISSALLGCVAGAGVAGYLSVKYGRKKILLMSAIFFIISSFACMIAETLFILVIARISGGV